MSASTTKLAFRLILIFHFVPLDRGCGPTTHTEIAHRALEFFTLTTAVEDYKRLIQRHRDALQAGSNFPDAFYLPTCMQGRYHNVSEDTHWGGYLNASINYIRLKYPPPWDTETQKFVVFLLGVVSHQVSDISWHSLGIDQGFIRTMSKVNFHDDYPSAHETADAGGDVVNQYELDTEYINKWYVPSEDLVEIYTLYYGSKLVSRDVVEDCTAMLLLQRFAEEVAAGKLFPFVANLSPFLVDLLNPYFLGGVDDMAAWTRHIWRDFVHMLEHGVQSCDLPHNTLFTHCNESDHGKIKHFGEKETNGIFVKQYSKAADENFTRHRTKRGVYFSRAPPHKEVTSSKTKQKTGHQNQKIENIQYPKYSFSTRRPYSRLGWSIIAKDVNNDSLTDIILGAPGAGEKSTTGAVYILLGNELGFLTNNLVVEDMANITLTGPQNSRFGHALETVDLNKDGVLDLVVGAPGFGSGNLSYNGSVYVFFGTGDRTAPFLLTPHLTFVGQGKYLGLGWSFCTHGSSLLSGAPFASVRGGEQNGAVFIIQAKNKWNKTFYRVGESSALAAGSQNYSWFGYSIFAHRSAADSFLFVSAPTYRVCFFANCSFSKRDAQSVGSLEIFTLTGTKAIAKRRLGGSHAFAMFGSRVALSSSGRTLAISTPGAGINGSVENVTYPLDQSGSVSLFELSSILSNATTPEATAQFFGDRMFSRFGQATLLEDVDGDSVDDLLVSAPFRTEDLLDDFQKVEEGRIFVFLSKNGSLPTGNVTLNCGSHHFVPCTTYAADIILSTTEARGRLGTTVVTAALSSKTFILSGSPHSDSGARLGGAVSLFEVDPTERRKGND